MTALCQNDVEHARITALQRYKIMGSGPEERFDSIARLAATLFDTPMALVSFLDEHRQWLKARFGVEASETSREDALCNHTIASDAVCIGLDMTGDSRFANNSFVRGAPHLRFYAGAPIVSPDGHRIGSLCVLDTKPRKRVTARQKRVLRDLAAQVMEQCELRRTQCESEAVRGFANATELGLISLDSEGKIHFANPSALQIFGYQREEMIGRSLDMILPEEMRAAHAQRLIRVLATGQSNLSGKSVEVLARRRDGRTVPVEISVSVWTRDGRTEIGAIMRDISKRKERDARLMRMAHHDALTGLYNRRFLEDRLDEMLQAQEPFTVMLLDLDGVKDVNDRLGHAMGDALLRALAVRLLSVLPDNAVVARFGGDEFAVAVPGSADLQTGDRIGRAMLAAFETSFHLDDQTFELGASIGYALAPQHGDRVEELVSAADFALYRAKDEGGRSLRVFEPVMRSNAMARSALQDEVRDALGRGEFVLHYQPQIALATGTMTGVEALLRWNHPERGLLLPGAFLPALESSAVTQRLGGWIVEQAAADAAFWKARGHNLRLAVNLFASQFYARTHMQRVMASIAAHGLDPHDVEIEITEQIALDSENAVRIIGELRRAGFRVAFDDFGTGYASLGNLQNFPLTTLKIDRGFVRDLPENRRDLAIIKAILAIAEALELEVIAEGIETSSQAKLLSALGCQIGQGFLFSPGVPAHQITAMLADPNALSLMPSARIPA